MISRFVTITAAAGVALLSLPVLAQTGTGTMTPQTTMPQTGMPDSTMGSGSTNTAPATTTPGPAPMTNQAQAAPHVRHVRHMAGNDAAERRVTECLNSAAAQQSSLDACRR